MGGLFYCAVSSRSVVRKINNAICSRDWTHNDDSDFDRLFNHATVIGFFTLVVHTFSTIVFGWCKQLKTIGINRETGLKVCRAACTSVANLFCFVRGVKCKLRNLNRSRSSTF